MEAEQQVAAFAGKLSDLGYSGHFISYDGDAGSLEKVLQQFLQKNEANIQEIGDASTTVSTVTDGTHKLTPATIARFLVYYEAKHGFFAGHLIVSRVDEGAQLLKSNFYHFSRKRPIPGAEQANSDVIIPHRNTDYRHRQRRPPG